MKKEKQSIKSTLRTLIRINHILKNASIKLYLISFLSSIFLGICTPLGMWIWKNILDIITKLLNKQINLNYLVIWIFVYFIFQLFQKVIIDISEYYKIIYAEYIDLYIKKILLSSISKIELCEFDDYKLHDEIAKASQESSSRSLNTLQNMLQMFQYIFSFFGSALLLINFHTSIIFLTLIYAIPLFFVSIKIMDQLFDVFDERFERIRFARGLQSLMIKPENIKEIKIYKLNDFIIDKITSIYQKNIDEDKVIRAKVVCKNSLVNCLEELVNACIKFIIIILGLIDQLTIGSINMYMSSVDNLALAVSNILGLSSNLYENTLYLNGIFCLIDRKNKVEGDLKFDCEFNTIEFRNVSFKYPGSNEYVLRDINLKLHANETYALVGQNGSGKTTLIKLLLKLYTPTEGDIFIDGVNLKNVSFDDMRKYVNAVFQDFVKYPFDIKTNIGIGDLSKIDDLNCIKRSAALANIKQYIESLPNQYNTQLLREWKESTDISLGQWQKIAVARAFMKESSILVLDEPTASMDALAELEIFQTFDKLKKNQLCIFVTHRLSNIGSSDQIIVLDKGEVIEQGVHKDLIKKDGKYKKLFDTQVSLYKKGGIEEC